MINKKHIEDLRFVVDKLIDEIAAIQSAMNRDEVGPQDIRNFYVQLDFAEYRVAGIMYGASVELDGAYNEDD